MSTPDDPAQTAPPPKHTGGKFRKGVSGNPGGNKRAATATQQPKAPQVAPQADPKPQTHPEVEQPIKVGREKDRTFAKGFVANPAGKPKGAKNHATRLVEALLDGQAHALGQRAIELAMGGDASVMRALLDCLIAPRKDRPVSIAMPKINTASDLIAAAAALTSAVSDGEITPGEAASLSTLVANTAKAVETFELADRLAKLEEQMTAKGSNP
jgi:hypothetical protein